MFAPKIGTSCIQSKLVSAEYMEIVCLIETKELAHTQMFHSGFGPHQQAYLDAFW